MSPAEGSILAVLKKYVPEGGRFLSPGERQALRAVKKVSSVSNHAFVEYSPSGLFQVFYPATDNAEETRGPEELAEYGGSGAIHVVFYFVPARLSPTSRVPLLVSYK